MEWKFFFWAARLQDTNGAPTPCAADRLLGACDDFCPWAQKCAQGPGIRIVQLGAVTDKSMERIGRTLRSLYMSSFHANVLWRCSPRVTPLGHLCMSMIRWIYSLWSLMEWLSSWLRHHWVPKIMVHTHQCSLLGCRSFGIPCTTPTSKDTRYLGARK